MIDGKEPTTESAICMFPLLAAYFAVTSEKFCVRLGADVL